MPGKKKRGPWAPNPSVRKALRRYYDKCMDRYGDKEYCARVAWSIYCSHKNPDYKGCTEMGRKWGKKYRAPVAEMLGYYDEEDSFEYELDDEILDEEIFEVSDKNLELARKLEKSPLAKSYMDREGRRHWIIGNKRTGALIDLTDDQLADYEDLVLDSVGPSVIDEKVKPKKGKIMPKKAIEPEEVNMKLPKGVKIWKRIGKDYWYVKRGAVVLGVISPDNEGGFDADLNPASGGKDEYREGFPSIEAAATWILSKEGLL